MRMLNSSSQAVVVTQQGTAIKARSANVRRIPESERWDADRILGMRPVPWSPDGSDNAFNIQVGVERPAEMVPRAPREVLMENKVARTYLRSADFEQWGLSEGCLGCRYLKTDQERQQSHSEACRRRIEGLLKGDPAGSARMVAADEKINRALAGAVERHATMDPNERHTEEGQCCPSPRVRILEETCATTSCHTVDHRRQVYDTAPPQAPTRAPARATQFEQAVRNTPMAASRWEETVRTITVRDTQPSGSDSRRRITAKREPREVRVEQPDTTEQHVPRRLFGKTTPQGHAVAVTTQEALDGSRGETMRIANAENNAVNWVSISRHIIGSSEPDVIIGSDKDRNRGCRKKDKDHIEFLCELYERRLREADTSCTN